MKLRDRIGIELSRRIRLEEGIEWAARNDIRFIDIQLDAGVNAMPTFDDARSKAVKIAHEKHGIRLGLHTLSAVNVAEYSPFVADGVEQYLKAYVDIAPKLGAEWIIVHAGYHFTKDIKLRMEAGRDRLKRIADYAEKKNVSIWLENLNREPKDAEVHYLAHSLEEWRYYWDIQSPNFRLSFTANHAHLMPEGIEGFVDALDFGRVGEVRLADCFRNGYEQHLKPGDGNLDFGDMFKRIEAKGFTGQYTNAFTTLEDMLAARDYLVEKAQAAGVPTA